MAAVTIYVLSALSDEGEGADCWSVANETLGAGVDRKVRVGAIRLGSTDVCERGFVDSTTAVGSCVGFEGVDLAGVGVLATSDC